MSNATCRTSRVLVDSLATGSHRARAHHQHYGAASEAAAVNSNDAFPAGAAASLSASPLIVRARFARSLKTDTFLRAVANHSLRQRLSVKSIKTGCPATTGNSSPPALTRP